MEEIPPQYIMGGIFPQKPATDWAQTGVCTGFDWLKIATRKKSENFAESGFLFPAKTAPVEGKFFKKIQDFETIIDGVPDVFCTCEWESRLESMSRDWVFVKIQNKWLYYNNFPDVLESFLRETGLEFHHITRLDAFLDCQQNFLRMEPGKFVEAAYTAKIVKYGTRHIEAHRDKDPHAITFGRLKSGFQVQWYDKSLELQKKIFKPYIYDNWIRSGMDMQQPVYRLEFRLSQSDMRITHPDLEYDFRSFKSVYLEQAAPLVKLLHDKYFKFKKFKKGVKKREHWNDWYFTKLDKFNVNVGGYAYKKYVSTPASGKQFVKRLLTEVYKLQGGTPEKLYGWKFIETVCIERSLTSWFENEFGTYVGDIIKMEQELFDKAMALKYTVKRNPIIVTQKTIDYGK